MNTNEIKELKQKAKIVRENILDYIGVNKKGHLGGSMSSADLVTALYFYKQENLFQKSKKCTNYG